MTVKVNNIYMKIGLLMIVSSLLLLTTACGNDAPEGVDQDLWDGYKKYSKLIKDKWENGEKLSDKDIVSIDNFVNRQRFKNLNENEQQVLDFINLVFGVKMEIDEGLGTKELRESNEMMLLFYEGLDPEKVFELKK